MDWFMRQVNAVCCALGFHRYAIDFRTSSNPFHRCVDCRGWFR